MAHVTAHAALPADGHGAGLAEEQEDLGDAETETETSVRLGIQATPFRIVEIIFEILTNDVKLHVEIKTPN